MTLKLTSHMRISDDIRKEVAKIYFKHPEWKFRKASDIYREIFKRGLETFKNEELNSAVVMGLSDRIAHQKAFSQFIHNSPIEVLA